MQVLLLAGDTEIVEHLELLLRQQYVTMLAYDTESVLEVLRHAQQSGLTPDLVMISTNTKNIDSFQLAQEIAQTCKIPVMFLNPRSDAHIRAEALLTPSADFITEPTFNVGDLLDRIHRVLRRLHPSGTPTAANGLTNRQRQILPLVAHGLTDDEIAKVLGLTGRTIKHHIYEACRRPDATNRAHLVSIALRQRLIPGNSEEM